MSLSRKKGWRKLTAWLITVIFMFTLMPQGPPAAAAFDPTRFKDVVINIDDAMLSALGVTSSRAVSDAIRNYLLSQGAITEKLMVRSDVTEIDTTDLTQFVVYDNYDNSFGTIPSLSVTGWVGNTLTTNNTTVGPHTLSHNNTTNNPGILAYWEAIYGRALDNDPSTSMRPYFSLYDNQVDNTYSRPTNQRYSTIEDLLNAASAAAPGSTNNPSTTGVDNETYEIQNRAFYAQNLREHIFAYTDSDGLPGMWFMGYGYKRNADYLFYPTNDNGTKNVKFTVDSSFVNRHALEGAGFLINTGIDSSGNIHGYIVYFNLTSAADASTPDALRANKAYATHMSLYKINNGVSAATLHRPNAGIAGQTTLIQQVALNTSVTNGPWLPVMDVEIDVTPTSVVASVDGHDSTPGVDTTSSTARTLTNTNLTKTNSTTEPSEYHGFGPYVNYFPTAGHTCGRGSAFKFSNLRMSIASISADVFLPILPPSVNSEFRPGNDVDRFYVNMVSNQVNSTIGLDYWDGIDDLRADKTFYITQNTDNTVVENYPGGMVTPAPDNLTNGVSGYNNSTGWPRYDNSGNVTGSWNPANISAGDKAKALQDLAKYFGDYILETTTADWVEPTAPSQNPKPRADVDFAGTHVNGGATVSPLSGMDAQKFNVDPVNISIINNFDNFNASDPYVSSGGKVTKLVIDWVYRPLGASKQYSTSGPPFNITPQETIIIGPGDPAGTEYQLQNFSFNPSKNSTVTQWPAGEYIATIKAYGDESPTPIESAAVTKSITLKRDTLPATAVLNTTSSGSTTPPSYFTSLKDSKVYRGLDAIVDLSDNTTGGYDYWGADRYKIGFGEAGIYLTNRTSNPVDGTPSGHIDWDTSLGNNGLVTIPGGPIVLPPHVVNITDLTKNAFPGITSNASLYVYVWDWVGNASLVEIPIATNTVTFSTTSALNSSLTASDVTPAPDPCINTYFRLGEKLSPMPAPPTFSFVDGNNVTRTLVGYNTTPNAPSPITDTEGLTITGDMVLYPVFDDPDVKFTVKFDTDGGSPISDQIVQSGGNATVPIPAPAKSGYSIDDWYTDANYQAKFDFSKPIYGDTTVYIKWVQDNAPQPVFWPVQRIEDLPITATVNVPLPLSGTVHPINATNKTITWQLTNPAVDTDVDITNGIFTASTPRWVSVTATVVNGASATSPFSQTFLINVKTAPTTFIPVTGIGNVPASATAGIPLTLTGATVNPSDATNKTIEWEIVSGGNIATITNGILSTTAPGTVQVVATVKNGKGAGSDYNSQPFTITVGSSSGSFEPVTGLTRGMPSSVDAGTPLTLSAVVSPSNATNQTIAWKINPVGTTDMNADIVNGNILNTTSPGNQVVVTATITNGVGVGTDYTQDFTITVNPPSSGFRPVTDIKGVPTVTNAGTPLTLTGVVEPSDATNKDISWDILISNDINTKISNGVLHTTAAGNVQVEATVKNGLGAGLDYKASFPITVNAPLTSFYAVDDISNVPGTITVGAPLNLTNAIVAPNNATNQTIDWSITNALTTTTGAQIDSNNVLNTTAPGTVELLATIVDGAGIGQPYTQSFTITVNQAGVIPPGFEAVGRITNVPSSVTAGSTLTLTGTVDPTTATNQTIVWSLDNANGTGSTLSGNVLTAGATNGNVRVKATIADGVAVGSPYEEYFDIAVTGGNPAFIKVDKIDNIPTAGIANKPLDLTGATVDPSNANNKTIVWTITDQGTTGATITNGILNTNAAGTVTIEAKIENGLGQGQDFVETLTITIIPESNYSLTVVAEAGGFISLVSPPKTDYVAGENISVEATAHNGYQFDKWAVSNNGLALNNPSSNPLNFNMPTNSVFLTAIFAKLPPIITGITVAPSNIQVVEGKTHQFVATVQGINNPPQNGVVWSVSSNVYGTAIDQNGLLTAGSGDNHTVTVTAEIANPDITQLPYSATATVDVLLTGSTPTPVHEFTINVPGSGYDFPTLESDYTTIPETKVVVTNTGNQPTGNLTPSSSDDPNSSFEIIPNPMNSLNAGDSAEFTIKPKPGLPPGTHTETIIITDSSGNAKSFPVTVIVEDPSGSGNDKGTPGNQNDQDIAKGKSLIETNSPLNPVPQAVAYDQASAEAEALRQINDLLSANGLSNVTATINSDTFTAAVAGNLSDLNGTDGSLVFKVTLRNPGAGADQTTATIVLPIIATQYTSTVIDQDIINAKNIIESNNPLNAVDQDKAPNQAAAEAEALKQINELLRANGLSNVTAMINSGTFTAAVSGTASNKAGTNGSYTFTVTLSNPNGTTQTTTTITLPITATEYTSTGGGGGGGGSTTTKPVDNATGDTTGNTGGTGDTTTGSTGSSSPYSDVNTGHWFYNDVLWAHENGYMDGIGDGKFGPQVSTERAMIVTVFYRLEGQPAVSGSSKFKDVPSGAYYTNAVIWAEANGIALGYTDGTFKPNQIVSRQELTAFFERYAAFKEYDISVRGDLARFKDQPAQWARENVRWAVGADLMQGKNENTLDPRGTATRAEFAAMLHRFIEKFAVDNQ